ncbi:DUF2460 domain-containing protein [Chelativorans sp. SCAU2101]|uniref:DUF2460 domain-containing protein n=1 Tax=Chelativorans petroleitrophicus TaxID=2975484 RepID=A0A9X3B7E9_9HYPH|nr:DUF2460 domain-containing protein [Chelativorans petroleitrophicus]MCT8991628.1 DUF2460 domain-containing protein [Chelativorans petroleitrophicus]
MNSFHDVRFPLSISFGATGGPERRNEIVLLTSGREKRNARTARSRRRYDAGTGVRSLEDLYEVLAFFEARRGSLHAFRFRDPFDMKSCAPHETPGLFDQQIGVGDGQRRRFALVKTYGEGPDAYQRPITRPVAGSVFVAVAGVQKTFGTDYSIDPDTGEVVFEPHATPAIDEAVTTGFEFDVPVRFDTDQLSASITAFKAGQIPSIPLVEVL